MHLALILEMLWVYVYAFEYRKPMDKGAWQATHTPWGCKRVGHDLATKQQQYTNVQNQCSDLAYQYYCANWPWVGDAQARRQHQAAI